MMKLSMLVLLAAIGISAVSAGKCMPNGDLLSDLGCLDLVDKQEILVVEDIYNEHRTHYEHRMQDANYNHLLSSELLYSG